MTAEILKRLEGLSGPDREVDCLIYAKLMIPQERIARLDIAHGYVGWWPKDAPYESAIEPPRYTASLDASIALVEKMLPGAGVGIFDNFKGSKPAAFIRMEPGLPIDLLKSVMAVGNSRPLAVCSALFRALPEGQP